MNLSELTSRLDRWTASKLSLAVIGFVLFFALIAAYSQYLRTIRQIETGVFSADKTFSWKNSSQGIYRVDAKEDYESLLLSDQSWSDFEWSFVFINPRDGGIIFDYRDKLNYYFLYFNKEAGIIVWGVTRDGNYAPISKMPYIDSPQIPCVLKLQNHTAQLMVAGQVVSEIPVDYQEGKIGFMLKDAALPKILFKQISIEGHDDAGQSLSIQEENSSRPPMVGLWAIIFVFYFLMFISAGYIAYIYARYGRSLSAKQKHTRVIETDEQTLTGREKVGIFGLHLLITLVLFWPFILKGEVLVSSGDNFGEIFPLFFYSKHNFWKILHGTSWGLWNPYVHNGLPFFSNHWNMIFYPLNWIVFLFPDGNIMPALTFRTLIEVLLIGLVGYGFFWRELRSKRWAFFCSVVYQLCSLLIFCLTVFPAISLYFAMTLYVYSLWSMPSRRAVVNYFWLTCSVVLILTSANMVFIFYTGIALVVFTIYRISTQYNAAQEKMRGFSLVMGSVLTGFLISAVRIIPCAMGIMESNRIVNNYYTLHDRLFLWIRLFVPEIVSSFDLNPLTSSNTNIVFQSIDMPSNPQNAFFVYFGIVPAVFLLLSLFIRAKGPYAFWKIYSWTVLGVALLLQPVWGFFSILFFPLVHYSYHIIILPVGLCALFGHVGMLLEQRKISFNALTHPVVFGFLLIQTLLLTIITYMIPAITPVVRWIFWGMIIWYLMYRMINVRWKRWNHWYLSLSSLVMESGILVLFFLLSALVVLKPIARKEDYFHFIIFPSLMVLCLLVMAIRVFVSCRSIKNQRAAAFFLCAGAVLLPTVICFLISSSHFQEWLESTDNYRNYFISFLLGEMRFVAVIIIGLMVFVLNRIKYLSRPHQLNLLILVTVFDLIAFNARFDNVVAPSPYNRAFYPAAFPYRNIGEELREKLDVVNYRCNFLDKIGLNSNKSLIFNIPSYTGIVGYMPKRFHDLVKSFGYPPTTTLIYPKDSTEDPRFLDLSSVKYDFTDSGDVAVRTTALSKLSLFYSYQVIPDEKQLLDQLHNPAFNPRQEILLPDDPHVGRGDLEGTDYHPLKIKGDLGDTDLIQADVHAARPGLLLFNESYHQDWKAFVDEKEAPVYIANYNFMACPVPEGTHAVRFEFRPRIFFFLLKISLLTAGVFAVILLGGFFTRKKMGKIQFVKKIRTAS